jgi:hypothetical protein
MREHQLTASSQCRIVATFLRELAGAAALYFCTAAIVLAQEGADARPVAQAPKEWWQLATGIIGVPVSLLGLIGAYQLTQKMRLETRKLKLEILEKERTLSLSNISEAGSSFASPRIFAATIQDFLARFIILELVRFCWGLISGILSPIVGLVIDILEAQGGSLPGSLLFAVGFIFSSFNVVGLWVIFLLFGWPLLTDLASTFGLALQFPGRKRVSRGADPSA